MQNEMMTIQDIARINDIMDGKIKIADIVEIEDVLLVIRQAEQEMEFLEQLKKRRSQIIDTRIAERESKIDKLRDAIKDCLVTNGKKNVDFPDIARVTVSKKKGTWLIEDEKKVLDAMKAHNLYGQVAEETVKIKKKELNKVLDDLEKNRNVPDGAKREDEKDSLSVSFAKQADHRVQNLPDHQPQTLPPTATVNNSGFVKTATFDFSTLDGL